MSTSTAARRLLEELSRYEVRDPADRDSCARVVELIRTVRDPFTREVPDHVTAAAVIARPNGSEFLLVYHRRLARWLQPGGHIEPEDASVLDAARREAREETGVLALDLPFDRILDVDVHEIPAAGDRPAHVHYDVRYLFTTIESHVSAALAEVREARWFPAQTVKVLETDDSLLRAIAKARRLLGNLPVQVV